jgi:hypothetical protein
MHNMRTLLHMSQDISLVFGQMLSTADNVIETFCLPEWTGRIPDAIDRFRGIGLPTMGDTR